MRRNEALERLRMHRTQLASLGVSHAYLFGSVARDTGTESSDIDVVVDSADGQPLGLFALARVTDALELIFDCSVDVISKAGLEHTTHMKHRIAPDLIDAF